MRTSRWLQVLLSLLFLMVVACGSNGDGTADTSAATNGDTEPPATEAPPATEPNETTEEPSAEAATVRLGFAFPPDFSMPGYYVSEELGYFAEENITVELIILDGTAQVIQQLIAGNIDVGVGGPPTAVILAGQEGADVAAFYQIDQRNIFDIVVPAASDLQELGDLDGEVLGVTNFAGGEIPVVDAALTEVGLRDGEEYVGVEVVAVGDGGPQVAAALESGTISAFSGGDADTLALQQLGFELRSILPEKYAVIPGNLIMATNEVLSSQSDLIARFGRAFAKGAVFAIASPSRALEYGCDFAPESCTDPAFADLAMDYYVELGTPPEGSPMGEVSEDGWNAVLEILVAQGEVPAEETIDTYIDASLLDQINDFDMSAVESDATS